MVGSGVLLDDVEAGEFGLEAVAGVVAVVAAGEAGGVDHSVVGQGGGGNAVLSACLAEGVDDVGAGDAEVRGDGQGVAGVVVEPGQDLDVDTVVRAGSG